MKLHVFIPIYIRNREVDLSSGTCLGLRFLERGRMGWKNSLVLKRLKLQFLIWKGPRVRVQMVFLCCSIMLYWDTIKEDLMMVFKEFYERR